MWRRIAVALWMFALAIFPLSSHSQVFVHGGGVTSHGIPASVTSPTPDGRLHGIPSSVTSPTPDPFFPGSQFVVGGHPVRGFRGMAVPQRRHHGSKVVTVPIYVPTYAYPYGYYPYQSEDSEDVVDDSASTVPAQPEPPARTIFERRSSSIPADAQADNTGDSRYGEHYLDSREAGRAQPKQTPDRPADEQASRQTTAAAAEPPETLPNTVLIFRDGHRAEVRDYAIVGATLYELGTAHVMKKIPLATLDLNATRKENELNGVDFHLP
jgi:hypothetical protein